MRKVMLFVLFVSASVMSADNVVLRGGTCDAGTWGTPDTGGRLDGVSVFMKAGVTRGVDAYKVCAANSALAYKRGCFTHEKRIKALKTGVKGVTVTFVRSRVPGGPDHWEISGATEEQLRSIFSQSRWECP